MDDLGPPAAADQSFWGTHDNPISGTLYATGGSGMYSFSVDTGPSEGIVSLDQSGSFTYTPNFHSYGVDSFTFIVTDTSDGEFSTPATANITVQETAPTAGNYDYTILHDQAFGVGSPGVMQNSMDNEGDSLSVSLNAGPANAQDFELNSDGSWAYLPNVGYVGDDSFSFNVTDGIMTVTGMVTLHITDQKPVAQEDKYYFSATDTQEVVGMSAGVQPNDSDPDDGDVLKSYVVTAPASGSLTLNTDGSFIYTPVPSAIANGATITFTYKDSDGAMYSDVVTVTMYFIHVVITNPVASKASGSDDRRDGSNQLVTGIDLFANVLAHEHVHVQQIASADQTLGSNLGQPGYAAGWSWSASPNNHSIPDGMGGMTNLDAVDNNSGVNQPDDIPDSWGPYSIEGAAGKAETVPENTYWQSDWADPGKQHAQDQVDSD